MSWSEVHCDTVPCLSCKRSGPQTYLAILVVSHVDDGSLPRRRWRRAQREAAGPWDTGIVVWRYRESSGQGDAKEHGCGRNNKERGDGNQVPQTAHCEIDGCSYLSESIMRHFVPYNVSVQCMIMRHTPHTPPREAAQKPWSSSGPDRTWSGQGSEQVHSTPSCPSQSRLPGIHSTHSRCVASCMAVLRVRTLAGLGTHVQALPLPRHRSSSSRLPLNWRSQSAMLASQILLSWAPRPYIRPGAPGSGDPASTEAIVYPVLRGVQGLNRPAPLRVVQLQQPVGPRDAALCTCMKRGDETRVGLFGWVRGGPRPGCYIHRRAPIPFFMPAQGPQDLPPPFLSKN